MPGTRNRSAPAAALIAALAVALAACGAAERDVVEPGSVDAAGGAPRVARVVDLGDLVSLPLRGPLPLGDGDGRVVVGELVLIEGEELGLQPTVAIGGRPCRVLARTGGGGIVVRVPPGVPGGATEVEVRHDRGRGAAPLTVERLALVVEPGTGVIHMVGVGERLRAASSLRIAGARDAAIAADGQVAYVTIDPPEPGHMAQLAVLRLAARGGPRQGRTRMLESARAEVIAVAAEAPVAAIWGAGRLTILDLGQPRTPDLFPSVPLPGAVVALAVAPGGRRMAALTAEGRLVPIDLADPARPRVGDALRVVDEPVPVAQDLAVAPGGDELWVLSGEGEGSAGSGRRPARITVVDWSGDAPALGRTVELPIAGAPRRLALSRREAIGSATAVRSTARRVTAVVSSVAPALLSGGAAPAGELGALSRIDLDGDARALGAGDAIYGALALVPDARRALATYQSPRGDGTLAFGVVAAPVDGGMAEALELGEVPRELRARPGGLAIAP